MTFAVKFYLIFFIFYFLFCIACGMIAASIQKNHPGKTFFIGFCLGPLGIALVMFFELGKCSLCGSRLADHASYCPGCYNEVVTIKREKDYVIWPCNKCGILVKNKIVNASKVFPCPNCKQEMTVPRSSEIGLQITVPNN